MAPHTIHVKNPARSNPDFARRLGIHYTMASRLRNGRRMPSAALLGHIVAEFELDDHATASIMEAAAKSPEDLGQWINKYLFVAASE